jgi:uncharacterized membrane-anchored protein
MAFQHIHFNDQTQYGRQLRRMLQQAEESDEATPDILQTMVFMCEGGDTSNAANFTEVTTRFGFASNAKAKEAYDELASFWSKISGNGSVQDVRAARDQLFNKLRG